MATCTECGNTTFWPMLCVAEATLERKPDGRFEVTKNIVTGRCSKCDHKQRVPWNEVSGMPTEDANE